MAVPPGAADPDPDASLRIATLHAGLFGRSGTGGGRRAVIRLRACLLPCVGVEVMPTGVTAALRPLPVQRRPYGLRVSPSPCGSCCPATPRSSVSSAEAAITASMCSR